MSAPQNELERYLQLADREACDEALSVDDLAFCRAFERKHPEACPELGVYAELAQLNAAPDAASRVLVDRALAQIESEDAERASEDVKRLRGRRVPGFVIAIAAAAFALGSGYALLTRNPSAARVSGSNPLARAELVYTSGAVTISDANGTAGRTLLSEGSTIATENGSACVLIDSDINVCLAPQSRMRLRTIASAARIVDLESGKLATRLATQPEGMSLSIVAAGVSSTAIGTAYSVELTSPATVTTTVLNGKVRVGRDAEVVMVSAHERAVSQVHGQATKPVVTTVSRTEEAPSWALLGPTVLWHDPVAATLEVHGQPAGVEAWLDDQWLGITPVTSLIPAGEHRLSVRKHNQELVSRDVYVHAGDTQSVGYAEEQAQAARVSANGMAGVGGVGLEDGSSSSYDDRDDVRSPGHSPRRGVRGRDHSRGASYRSARLQDEPVVAQEAETEAEPSGGLGLRQARQALRAGQFRAAAAIYEQLSEGGASSEEASTAMIALGQLRLNQLGDPKGALAPLNAYLKRGGPLAVEARVARIEALRRLNRTGEERTAIEEFLRLHPQSFEAKRLQARLDSLRAAAR